MDILPKSIHLPDNWCMCLNIHELIHQLCSIQYRCRNGSYFSQRHRNNVCLKEMYKLFNWSMYELEQIQMLQTSIKERHLNSVHRDKHVDSSSAHKFLSSDGVVETLFPDLSYTIERHMPLHTMPQLDLYFTNSELVTLSLLSTACIKYLCKNDSEYCFIHFKKREFMNPPSTLQTTENKCSKRKTPPTMPSTSPILRGICMVTRSIFIMKWEKMTKTA